MPGDARIGAAELRATARCYRDALKAHRNAINRLNVYPVPDGDTGTNMALTLDAVCTELGDGDGDLAETCRAIGHGSLMGARGNSGVILSQVLRGLVGVLKETGEEGADGDLVAAALAEASKAAYGAVMRPVEGTILTVVREAAEGAEEAAAAGRPLLGVLEAARASGADALTRTPDMLPVLAEAGVVDAGGAGLLLLLDALLHVLDGRPLPEPPEVPEGTPAMALAAAHAAAGGGDGHGAGTPGVDELRYEVMYLLEAVDAAVPAFKDVWAGIGDSIVVVGGDGLWNCHIHTDDIGAAIEAGVDCGRPRNIRVTDLHEQVEEERWVRDAGAAGPERPPHLDERVATAVVAVATGEGLRRIFYSLGVQGIVGGGQSMNPSTAQLLEAVEASPADEVVVLPNNKNIVPVAEQLDDLTTKSVRVVPTASITEGFAALMTYDPESSADENAAEMASAAATVVAGEVTQAVRDAGTEAGPVTAGDWIGLDRGGVRSVDDTLAGAARGLLDLLVEDDHEIVTIIEGEGASAADTRRITEWLHEHRPQVACEVHHGGQPLYPYLFGIE